MQAASDPSPPTLTPPGDSALSCRVIPCAVDELHVAHSTCTRFFAALSTFR
jgi:hypothetical protein